MSFPWFGPEDCYFYYRYKTDESRNNLFALFSYNYKTKAVTKVFESYSSSLLVLAPVLCNYPILSAEKGMDRQYGTFFKNEFIFSEKPIVHSGQDGYVYIDDGLHFMSAHSESSVLLCKGDHIICNNAINSDFVYIDDDSRIHAFNMHSEIDTVLSIDPECYRPVYSNAKLLSSDYHGKAYDSVVSSFLHKRTDGKCFLMVYGKEEIEVTIPNLAFEDIDCIYHFHKTPIYNFYDKSNKMIYTYDINEKSYRNDAFLYEDSSNFPVFKNIEYTLYSDERYNFYVKLEEIGSRESFATHQGHLYRSIKGLDEKELIATREVHLRNVEFEGLEFCLEISHIEPAPSK